MRPEQTEGPYFVDEMLNRSDIRSDPSSGEVKEGLPLQITMRVSQIGEACVPLAGAQVDIWHCDALGVYSDTTDQVHAQEPYASKGQRTVRNDGDGIYPGDGDQLMLQLAQADQGYAGTFDIGLQSV